MLSERRIRTPREHSMCTSICCAKTLVNLHHEILVVAQTQPESRHRDALLDQRMVQLSQLCGGTGVLVCLTIGEQDHAVDAGGIDQFTDLGSALADASE